MHDQSKPFDTKCGTDHGACCIDTYRIYDSCKNQECAENLRVIVTGAGQSIIDAAEAIRIKNIRVIHTRILTEEMPFNKGYYQISLRFYFQCILDCCTGLGTGQDVAGLAVFDKTLILFGGCGNVSSFQSEIAPSSFCAVPLPHTASGNNLPRAVVEIAEPVALRLNVFSSENTAECGICPCPAEEIPSCVNAFFHEPLQDEISQGKRVYLSMGLFYMVRIERPAQLVVPACDACVPKESCEYDLPHADPCSLFLSMDFPLHQFYPDLREEDHEIKHRHDEKKAD